MGLWIRLHWSLSEDSSMTTRVVTNRSQGLVSSRWASTAVRSLCWDHPCRLVSVSGQKSVFYTIRLLLLLQQKFQLYAWKSVVVQLNLKFRPCVWGTAALTQVTVTEICAYPTHGKQGLNSWYNCLTERVSISQQALGDFYKVFLTPNRFRPLLIQGSLYNLTFTFKLQCVLGL